MSSFEIFVSKLWWKLAETFPSLLQPERIKKIKNYTASLKDYAICLNVILYKMFLMNYAIAIKFNSEYVNSFDYFKANGNFCLRHKNYKSALDSYSQAIELDPSHASIYLARADCHTKLENYELALVDLTKAVALEPNRSKIYLLIADYYAELENDELALINYAKAIKLNPTDSNNYSARANYYTKQECDELALDDWIKVINIHPFNSKLEPIGFEFYDQGKYKIAIDFFSKLIEIRPDFGMYQMRGLCYSHQENYDLALKDFTKMIERSPRNFMGYRFRADLFREQKNYDFAITDYSKSIELEANNAHAYCLRGDCFLKQKKHELAFVDFDVSIELDSDKHSVIEASLQFMIMMMVLDNGGFEEIDNIINQCDKQLDIRQNICLLSKTIACKYGKYDKARGYVEKAFEITGSKESQVKNIYLEEINRTEELLNKKKELDKEVEEKETINKSLLAKEKELEDMMSMFAHKFRSPLDTIIYNTNHENSPKIYIEASHTMRGLLDIFSLISTDSEVLIEKIKSDSQGNSDLTQLLSNSLNMILLHFLSVSGAEKIRQHYINYAKSHGLCDIDISSKIWNEECYELEEKLQGEWEQSFSNLIMQSATLEQRLSWIEQHFFKLELQGFDNSSIQFQKYSTTESFLTIILSELIVNAFKYYAADKQNIVSIKWIGANDHQSIICNNPSTRSSRSRLKGSKKGHTFLSSLSHKAGCEFTRPELKDNFSVTFKIPNQLLFKK